MTDPIYVGFSTAGADGSFISGGPEPSGPQDQFLITVEGYMIDLDPGDAQALFVALGNWLQWAGHIEVEETTETETETIGTPTLLDEMIEFFTATADFDDEPVAEGNEEFLLRGELANMSYRWIDGERRGVRPVTLNGVEYVPDWDEQQRRAAADPDARRDLPPLKPVGNAEDGDFDCPMCGALDDKPEPSRGIDYSHLLKQPGPAVNIQGQAVSDPDARRRPRVECMRDALQGIRTEPVNTDPEDALW